MATITKQTRFGEIKALSDSGRIFWAEDGVWCNWPTLAREGVLRAEGKVLPNGLLADRGHLDLILEEVAS